MSTETIPVVAVGICGSDIQRYREGFALASLGHELVGRPSDGILVAVRPLRPCRTCPACDRGWTEHCANDTSIGRYDTGDGGLSGAVRVDSGQLYPLPAHLPAPLATLADPLACVLHAFRPLAMDAADVLVIGDGPMAALAAIRARQRNAWEITIAVKTADRIDSLSRFGDRVVTSSSLEADRYDVVIDAVGGISSEPILTAVASVAPLGQVVALGVYHPQATADLPVRSLLEKESVLRGSKAYRVNDDRDDFAEALELIAEKPGDFAPIISATRDWPTDVPQPFAEDRSHALKVVHTTERQRADRIRL